jgi:hypothetical protein
MLVVAYLESGNRPHPEQPLLEDASSADYEHETKSSQNENRPLVDLGFPEKGLGVPKEIADFPGIFKF